MEEQAKKEEEPKSVWDLQKGDEYYAINGTGVISRLRWLIDDGDTGYREMGNAYLTEQDAEDEVRARKLIALANKIQKEVKIDFKNPLQKKHHIYYDFDIKKLRYSYCYSAKDTPMLGYWENDEDIKTFIKENEDELVWFFAEYKGV